MKVSKIREERNRQVALFGGKEHDRRLWDDDWLLYISRRMRSIRDLSSLDPMRPERARRTALYTHIAALAVAAIEAQEYWASVLTVSPAAPH